VFHACGLIALTRWWPCCKKMIRNNEPMVGWNVLRLQPVGELFLGDGVYGLCVIMLNNLCYVMNWSLLFLYV
jgi:hypothetical protein